MHYLAHVYAQRNHLTPEFMFGLIIPDLVPQFTRLFNSKISKHRNFSQGIFTQLIHKGILAHYNDDRQFHQLPAFNNFCAELTQRITMGGINRNEVRVSVLAHLFTEILFDRWLAGQNSQLTETFYELLEQLNEQTVHLYMRELNLVEEMGISLEKRKRMLKIRFLYELNNSARLAKGVASIYEHTTGKAITKCQRFRIIEAIDEFYTTPRLWQTLLIR